jgi:hypothetical protein
MKLDVASYNDGAGQYNALAEETAFRTYKITQEFNRPAVAIIGLADPTGAITEKYNVTANAVYVGPGRVQLEDPTATVIFEGRILKARHDSEKRMCYLYCHDWLDQLDEERINYDMREDLDGAGLRESTIHADITLSEGDAWPTETVGVNYYLWDHDMITNWIPDQWNNYYILFSNKNTGSVTRSVGPYSDTSTADDGNYIGGWDKCWTADGSFTEDSDAGDNWFWEFDFPTVIEDGSLTTSIDTVRVTLLAYADGGVGTVAFSDDTVGWTDVGTIANTGADVFQYYTFTVPDTHLTDISTGGLTSCKVSALAGTEIGIDLFLVEVTFTRTGTSTAYTINDTVDVEYDVKGCVYDFGGGEIDETTDANDAGANDFPLFNAAIAQGDEVHFGFHQPCAKFKLNVGTAGDYDGTGVWKYWDGDSWESLVDVVDGTSGFEVAGTNTVSWTIPTDWAEVAVGGITAYWIKCEMITALPVTRTQPLGTQAWAVYSNKLRVDTDLWHSGLGMTEGDYYCICEEIYKHLDSAEGGTLITDGDALSSKTNGAGAIVCAAGVEHTSGISSRHYTERTRLEILKDLSKMDKSVFWITLGGTTLNWKSTFNDGAPTALTDASVLSWKHGEYDYTSMTNEYHIYGVRIGDEQVYFDTDDATDPGSDSKSTYGATRVKVYSAGGVFNQRDAEVLGDILVERDEDVHLFLRGEFAGLSSLRLGDEVTITSAYLLNSVAAHYIVSHWTYDSTTNITTVRFHPRVSQLGLTDHVFMGEECST